MANPNNTVAVLGLGYIGLPFTAALANVGYNVIGVDVDSARVKGLLAGRVPFYEPGMKETLELNRKSIEYTSDTSYALKKADTVFVTVGTPVKEDNSPDYTQIDSCTNEISKSLRKGQLIILKSTVVVGTTEERVVPKLEELSGMKAGKDFHLVFCPERTIEGLALHEIYHLPKIVGGVNLESVVRAENVIKRLGSSVKRVSSPRVAEMCKLVDNLYRSTNIAFANEMGAVCEKSGIDAREVVSAVNSSYARTNIFMPGLGADGPCLSKDPFIFKSSARKNGVETPVADGCIAQNKYSTLRLVPLMENFIASEEVFNPNIALIGLAFKGFPETDDLRGSPAQKILEAIVKKGIHPNSIRVYDPLVKNFGDYKVADSIEEALAQANIALFLTNHPRIMNLEIDDVVNTMSKPSLIIDAWGNLSMPNGIPEGTGYFRIGNGKK